jgi:hypothetical protein
VRPGGLSAGPGGKAVVFGQGDAPVANGGRDVDRVDVAAVVVNAIRVGPRNVTFEMVAAADASKGMLGAAPVQAGLRALVPDH